MNWIVAAGGAAFFAGIVSILAKLGVRTTDSDVATAIRTTVVLVCAWLVAACQGSIASIDSVSPVAWAFLILSGAATGASWLCYFKALSLADVSKVVPIDKSSAVIATLLAIVLFGETANIVIKLVMTALILLGTLMIIEPSQSEAGSVDEPSKPTWIIYAVLAAVFAALTAILGKLGIDEVESSLGTAIRTCVVLLMAWGIAIGRHKAALVKTVKKRELLFLVLSGIATAASWLCYYYAIQTGVVSVVVQIDKLSILVSVVFAWVVLREKLSAKAAIGLAFITAGTMAMTVYA